MKHSRPLLAIVVTSDLHVVRLMLGIAELIWAVTLLWPGDTFGRPTYFAMERVMDEEWWGLIFLATGLLQLWILSFEDYYTRASIMFSGFNCFLWNFVVLSIYASVWPPPAAISGEFVLSMAATWLFVRAGAKWPVKEHKPRGTAHHAGHA